MRKHILGKADHFETLNHQSRNTLFKTVAWRWIVLDSVAFISIFGIIGLSTYEILNGNLSPAAYATIIFLTVTIWAEMEPFAIVYAQMVDHWEGFKRLTEMLNEKPAIEDKKDATNLKTTAASITFDKVDFQYQKEKGIIKDFTLNIKKGEKIGLLGPSGAGKSTLIKLLMRFYDVNEGTIKINNHNEQDITQISIQEHIAVIPQDVVLFNHALIENIRYGRLNASDEEVFEAARTAHAHEFIEQLPDGYNTLVGERGVKLSGGQRQRIAIARAILKNAPILILDEATSALDSESEKFIQNALQQLMEGKTVIAIAHRLSTIAHLDRLVVMENGKILEHGTHEELLSTKGVYAS